MYFRESVIGDDVDQWSSRFVLSSQWDLYFVLGWSWPFIFPRLWGLPGLWSKTIQQWQLECHSRLDSRYYKIIIWQKFCYKIDLSVTILLDKINISIIYFENLIVKLYFFYTFNIFIKFYVNRIFLLYDSISLCFIHNFKLQKLSI